MDKNITTPPAAAPHKSKKSPSINSAPARTEPSSSPQASSKLEPASLTKIPLTSLIGCGTIASLSPSLEPRVSRRLEDLGFTPGEKIRPMLTSAFGGGAAYIIKGSVIVLRDTTASRILVISGIGGEEN